jgi:ATPase subunit of ABC transporter with duplicated ATPase domains
MRNWAWHARLTDERWLEEALRRTAPSSRPPRAPRECAHRWSRRAGLEELDDHVTQLAASGLVVEFGATTLFTDITFTVASGERWGIVGRNGTGKTTLFRLLTGEMTPTRGQLSADSEVSCSSSTVSSPARSRSGKPAGQFADLLALDGRSRSSAANLEHDSSEAALNKVQGSRTLRARGRVHRASTRFSTVLASTRHTRERIR